MTIKYDDGDFQATDQFNVTLEEENEIDIVGTWQLFGENCTGNTWSVTFFADLTMNVENLGSFEGCTDNGTYSFDGTNLSFSYSLQCDETSPMFGFQNDNYSFTGSINSDGNFTGDLTLSVQSSSDSSPVVTNCTSSINN